MRQSKLFGKTLRETPKDEQGINARLLIQAGFIDKLMAGVYSYLPLGYRVLKKIEQIIREEINAVGGQELLLPALQPKELWEKTGRWTSEEAVLYKLKDASDREFTIGPTHEEVITPLAKHDIESYRDLPLALYQFQTKYRAELRAKSGILRGREFLMKDLYSFHANDEDFEQYYDTVKQAYVKIFQRLGIGENTVVTFASGGTFSKYSHEFQTITSAGEDTIYLCESCRVAINKEIIAEQESCPQCKKTKENLVVEKAIEVGNIFPLKTRFSAPFELNYKDKDGESKPVIMGCYGIGLGRAMGTIVEINHDENGIKWPVSVAPFVVHLVQLGNDENVTKEAENVYQILIDAGVEVLYDDREISAGVKLKDADLLGIPVRVVVSEKTVSAKTYELKNRLTGEIFMVKNIVSEIKKLL